MKCSRNIVGLCLIVSLLFSQAGCALLTTRRIATGAAKVVGKKVYEEYKEDKAQNERAESEQGRQD